MGRVKKIITIDDESSQKPEFCTECGDDLNDFDLRNPDKKSVSENFERCKNSGKFKGDICSKLYIIDDNLNGNGKLSF